MRQFISDIDNLRDLRIRLKKLLFQMEAEADWGAQPTQDRSQTIQEARIISTASA